jgi:DNA-binding GntR family transcriptional regulator
MADPHATTSVDLVLTTLLDGIRQGRFVPGQRLIAGEVAAELGVSRAPVREALHVLAGEGVVELMPNQGARIVRLTAADLVHGMLMLKAVGALGIEYACANMDQPGNRSTIRQKAREVFLAGEARQPYPWFNGLIELHRLFNDISGNPYLNKQVYGRLHLVYFNRALSEKLPGRHWERYVANYRTIVDLVLDASTQKAVAAFNAHMTWAIDGLTREYLAD